MLEGFHPAKELRHHAGSRDEEGRERGCPWNAMRISDSQPHEILQFGWLFFVFFTFLECVIRNSFVDPNHFLTPDIYYSESLWTQMWEGETFAGSRWLKRKTQIPLWCDGKHFPPSPSLLNRIHQCLTRSNYTPTTQQWFEFQLNLIHFL